MRNILSICILFTMLGGCTSYGEKIDFQGDDLYYKSPVTKANANQLGEFLKSYQYFTGKGYAVQVIKDTTYTVRFATKDSIEQDEEVIGGFKFLLMDMSNAAFEGAPVNVDLCDASFHTKMSISYSDAKSFMEEMLLNVK